MPDCYTTSMDKSRRVTFVSYVYLSVFIIITGVIFLFASFTGEVSADQSSVFVEAIVAFLHGFGFDLGQAAVGALSTIVRKVIGHFLIFMADGVFAYLTAVSFFRLRRGWMFLLASALAMILVASVSEIIQLFASGRAGTLVDVILDSAGAFLGIGLSAWIRDAYMKKKELAL